jgi:hypothetical protein
MAGLRGQDLEAEKQRAQQQGDSSRGAQLAIQHTYEEVSMPKWEAMKKSTMVAPSSRQRKAMSKRFKKMGARDTMDVYDWDDLTFMRGGWELRTVPEKTHVLSSSSAARRRAKAAAEEARYAELTQELVGDTATVSTLGSGCILALEQSGSLAAGAAGSFFVGAAFAVLYVRLLSTEVDALKTPDQWGAEMSGQTDTERNPLRLAAPMRLALPASLVMAASPQGQHALTMLRDMLEGTANVDASGLTAYQMLPALGGFAMYKLGVAWQGTRLGLQAAGDDLGEVASQMERTSGA